MSEETRKNLLALAIVFGALSLVGLFAFRPGVVLSVGEPQLASSIARAVPRPTADAYDRNKDKDRCVEVSEDRFRCDVLAGGDSDAGRVAFAIEMESFGCWEGERVASRQSAEIPHQIDGCVWILDF